MNNKFEILPLIERRHGPLHGLIVAKVDQWRWSRQLRAITAAPRASQFGQLQHLHALIGSLTLEFIGIRARLDMRLAWQHASDAMQNVVAENERAWLAKNRF